MTSQEKLSCPECGNKYSTHVECPECKIPLIEKMQQKNDINGDNNQANNINGNNEGDIVNGPKIINQHQQDIAKYDYQYVTTYESFWELVTPWVYSGAALGVINLFTWLSGLASILSWIGWTPQDISFLESIIFLSSCGLGYWIFIRLTTYMEIRRHDAYRIKNRVYENIDGGRIKVFYVTGKCPIVGCPGYLHLGLPPKNIQGIDFAAMCDSHGFRHTFEFNGESLIGGRIDITPVPDSPKK